MRRILIDPLSKPIWVALAFGDHIEAMAQSAHSDCALALDDAFLELNISEKIDEIVVVNGPGNFTAIRAGIGYARGLGLAYGAPTRGISILEIDQCFANGCDVIRDARGGRVYLASGEEVELKFLAEISSFVVSFDAFDGVELIEANPTARFQAMLKLADAKKGSIPAVANYIRPADAAASNVIPPKLLDSEPNDD